MQDYRGDRHAFYTMELLLPIGCALISLVLLFGIPMLLPSFPRIILRITVGVLIAATGAVMLFWLPLWFHNLSYTITEQCIVKQSGAIFHRQQVILTEALQFSTILQLPFARYTGMTFLPLHAYGGTVLLLFLSPSDAASVCNYLFDHLYPTDSLSPAPEDSHAS